MCPPRKQRTPQLPAPRPTAPRPEQTAKNVVVGSSRTSIDGRKKSKISRRGQGTFSLRIPLAMDSTNSSNLRY